ncbi:DUF4013 domain-containing protein [Methanobacterium formicicum]|uniref:DUF4013 domain-containing protein n=1 Tax=Methanobacterium formicicum TaxID=2162 RepID=A0A090JUX7_METFO|nr:DUF4013 domain-containing protein [Methanobacterium formicicum]MDG3548228.1 DUF4013 domain-containing protein [Methanobacterium formicicum]MDH2659892.1 DUF4013 domain-containing protein [Methanobacterium formicicum]CEA13286.1 hypothetical protein DSM1535_0933 [Methanobacterium formicicum]
MDIGYLTSDAIKYPSQDWKKVLILGILILTSFLIVPAFLVMGYVFRAMKWSIAGVDQLPEFDEWGEMFTDGLKILVVELAYFIIPTILVVMGMWASLGALVASGVSGNELSFNSAFSTFGFMGGLIITGLVFAVIFGVFFTIAIANMAYHDSKIQAAFRFHEILNRIRAIGGVDYVIWYVMMIFLGIIISTLIGLLGFVPVLGWALIVLLLYPYVYLLYARALGLLFLSGLETQ